MNVELNGEAVPTDEAKEMMQRDLLCAIDHALELLDLAIEAHRPD